MGGATRLTGEDLSYEVDRSPSLVGPNLAHALKSRRTSHMHLNPLSLIVSPRNRTISYYDTYNFQYEILKNSLQVFLSLVASERSNVASI
jgi:hypothetical protein